MRDSHAPPIGSECSGKRLNSSCTQHVWEAFRSAVQVRAQRPTEVHLLRPHASLVSLMMRASTSVGSISSVMQATSCWHCPSRSTIVASVLASVDADAFGSSTASWASRSDTSPSAIYEKCCLAFRRRGGRITMQSDTPLPALR